MGMKEKCVCSTGRGFWDEQNCWLCKLCIWFLMNLSSCSLATELLLLAGDEQHKHTHTRAHTQKLHLQCKNFLHKKARTELYFVKKWGLSSNSRKKCFYSGWSLILIDSFLCSTRAIYIISESFMYHWAYTCDWGALHVGLLCSYFFQDFPRVNRERSEHSWRETTVSTGLGCFSPARSHRVNIYSVFWDLKKGNLFQYLWMWSNIKSSHSFQKPWQYACTRTDWRLKSKRKPHTARSDQVMEFIDIGG